MRTQRLPLLSLPLALLSLLVFSRLYSQSSPQAAPQSDSGICASFPLRPQAPKNLEDWLRLESCLDSLQDSLRPPFHSALRQVLPMEGQWYREQLSRLRSRREIGKALSLARLAEIRNLNDAALQSELSQVYLLDSRFTAAGRSFLRSVAAQSEQSGTVQYQLENMIRQASAWIEPDDLLDSLSRFFPGGPAVVHQTLEKVAWSLGHYPGAFDNLWKRHLLDTLTWEELESAAQRFQHAGYFDYTVRLLDGVDWQLLPAEKRKRALLMFHRVHFELRDWKTLASHPSIENAASYSPEQQYILAHALAMVGNPTAASRLLDKVEASQATDWIHRARILRARTLILSGNPQEALRLLRREKTGKQREAGTGPLLFWEAIASLHLNRYQAADSLFMQASAYAGSEEAQRSLQYRNWLMLDTSTTARRAFFHGLDEAPQPPEMRLDSLKAVPAASPLFPHARMEMAYRLLETESPDAALEILEKLASSGTDPLAVKAKALAAFILEARLQASEKAVVKYRSLLLEYQQGVFPEFSRRRMRSLNE